MLRYPQIIAASTQLLLAAFTIPAAAQDVTPNAPASTQCTEAYSCVDSKPLSEEEVRRNLRYLGTTQSEPDRSMHSEPRPVRRERKG